MIEWRGAVWSPTKQQLKRAAKVPGKEVHTMIRLNKYMSEAGVCSRREADRLIEAGKVTVDGMKATVGMQIEEGQKVCLNGKPVQKDKKDKLILLAVNKPRGCSLLRKKSGR